MITLSSLAKRFIFFATTYFTSLFELTQFSAESCLPSTVGSLISGTMVNDEGFAHTNLKSQNVHLHNCNLQEEY